MLAENRWLQCIETVRSRRGRRGSTIACSRARKAQRDVAWHQHGEVGLLHETVTDRPTSRGKENLLHIDDHLRDAAALR
jgi:gluconate kinase